MNKVIKYFLFGLAFIVVGLLAGFKIKENQGSPQGMSIYSGVGKLQHTLQFIQNNYVEDVAANKLVDDAIQGVMEGLDPHSFYIPASEMKQMREQMNGSFEGIGIQFNILEDTIYVETPLSGGPSEKLGIMAGDRIVTVDGENVAGIGITNSDVTKYLKGPKGTQVLVGILRSGFEDLLEFNITRDKIPLNSVDYAYMISNGMGYIRITRFAETTFQEFHEQLVALKEQGMESLILDLRGNPGGYMTQAYHIADEFLKGGMGIVSTEGRIPNSQQSYESTDEVGEFEKGGLIVLIDYSSASASEIVSGAIQDHDRGLIVGVRSFGKGLVQIQEEFEDGSAIRIVVSKYYTPSGRCIQKPYDKTSEEYDAEISERFQSGEIFDETKIQVPDSLTFRTDAGRIVYGGGGIYPDVFVPDDTTGGSKYFTDLRIQDMFRRFAAHYVDSHKTLASTYPEPRDYYEKFAVTQSLLNEFISFAEAREVPFVAEDYETSKKYIDNRIMAYIGRRLHGEEGFWPVIHKTDQVIQRARKLMPFSSELEETGQFSIAN
ncbi:S41 family peptidase [Pontibacter sp. G13]|uniref:S41 family peptidase n=1 Tax=Pontibacter sp. G13 TaxID=3074898 RepID=UPI00288A2C37|nr:S41 family peptidase [Pontibacter sp. G13]WNJ21118.1 S41 family peptidase [Pontibacter sp. G13]